MATKKPSAPAKPAAKEKPKAAGKAAPKKEKAPKKPHGRPTTYDQKVADEICERMANGEPLREICRSEGMPPWRTVYSWQSANPEFFARIAQSRELGEEAIFQDCLHIADNPLIGEEVEESENGKKIKRGDMLGHRKLQIETRLKLLAKWNPRKWGDKIDLNHGGQEGNPVQVKTKVVLVPSKQVAEVLTRPLKKDGE